MKKGRLEAFSDAVIAIIITIMVLELVAPHGADLSALQPLLPKFLAYALSFVYLGIYWNNHHHLFQAVDQVDGRVLWANMHLLFWLSLVPFATSWMGEHYREPIPAVAYGVVLVMSGVAYYILVRFLLALHGTDSTLAIAIGRDFKGILSVVIYLVAIPLAFITTWLSFALYLTVAIIWFIPDRRIERNMAQ
jgi:uncharacterized membrane protein